MLKEILGGFIILVSCLPVGIEVPGVYTPDLTYVLYFLMFLSTLYGASLLLDGEGSNIKGPAQVPAEPIAATMAKTKEYVKVHQSQRESRRAKNAG